MLQALQPTLKDNATFELVSKIYTLNFRNQFPPISTGMKNSLNLQKETGKVGFQECVKQLMKLIKETQHLTDSKKSELIQLVENMVNIHEQLQNGKAQCVDHNAQIQTEEVGSSTSNNVCTDVTVKPTMGKGPYNLTKRFGNFSSVTMTNVSHPKFEDSTLKDEMIKVKEKANTNINEKTKVKELKEKVKKLENEKASLVAEIKDNLDYKEMLDNSNLRIEELKNQLKEVRWENFVKGMGTGPAWDVKKKKFNGKVLTVESETVLKDEQPLGEDQNLKIKDLELKLKDCEGRRNKADMEIAQLKKNVDILNKQVSKIDGLDRKLNDLAESKKSFKAELEVQLHKVQDEIKCLILSNADMEYDYGLLLEAQRIKSFTF